MVWGMSLPSSFGDYWPEGRFEADPQQPRSPDWGDRLREYYFSQPPDVQRELYDHRGDDSLAASSYPYFVSLKFVTEQGVSINAEMPPITPVKPHEPPRFYQTWKNQKNLASLVKLSDRIIAVDDVLKSVIEKCEPNVHRFYPIEIKMRGGQVYPIAYYTLVICQYMDSFSPERSKKDAVEKWEGYDLYNHDDSRVGISGLAFKKSIFGESQLWRERRFTSLLTCFSDELQAKIAEAGLRIPKHYKMMEV